MPKKPLKQWGYSSKSGPKPKVPDDVQKAVHEACDLLLVDLKEEHIISPSEDMQYSYLVDLYNRWHRSFFYFCGKYRCPSPNCISEFFEATYTRLEYTSPDKYALAYMRHTGKWQEVYSGLSLSKCIETIKREVIFHPI